MLTVSPVPVLPVLGCACVRAWYSQDTITNCRISAQMCRHYALGCLLVILVLATQVGPARAYACTSDAGCQYEGCHDVSCVCPRLIF